MQIRPQGIITRDNVSIDVSAVAYFRVVDATESVAAIENVHAAINQTAQSTLRKAVGQRTLDETLSGADHSNLGKREILDVTTAEWRVELTLVELKDIQLPDRMKRAMARQAEVETRSEPRSSMLMGVPHRSGTGRYLGHDDGSPHGAPTAQSAEPGGDRRGQEHHGRVPRPLMSTIGELGSLLARETAAASPAPPVDSTRTIPGPVQHTVKNESPDPV